MAATVQIKRSTGNSAPSTLSQGELAYSAALDGSWNDASAGKLYVGKPSASGTAQVLSIGGTFYTSKIDGVTAGTAAANKVVLLDADRSVSNLGTVGATTFSGTVITGSASVTGGNLQLSGNTVSSTDSNGNIVVAPNGSGSVQFYSSTNQWTLPTRSTATGYVLTAGASGTTSWSPAVSVLTFNNGAGSTGTVDLLTQTFSIVGTGGIDVAANGQTLTLSVSAGGGAVTVTGTQTLSNKSLVDNSTWFVDDLDQTKRFKFQVASITAGQTRELTIQDQNGTVALLDNNLGQFASTTSDQLRSIISDETGTGSLVFSNSPSFVTPTLGAAIATTINNVTISNSTATLSLATGSTLATSGANSITLTSTGATNVTLPTAGTLATLAGAETLTNKTISTGSTYQGNVIDILYGGTGSSNGSITGSGQLVFTAGGANTSVVLAPNGSGTVDVSSKRITSLAEPTLSNDAATKNYVDNIATGILWKSAVLARATTNIALTGSGSPTVDGLAITETGSRVLLNGQTDTGTNGIYSVSFGGGNYTLARTSDANSISELEGAAVFVIGGSTWDNTGWIQSDYSLTEPSSGNFVPQDWVQFTGGGAIVGGAGITISSNVASADVDDVSIDFTVPGDSGKIQIKTGGVTYAKIQDVTELSVVGRASNTTGTVAAITASSDYQILRRSGTSLAFGSIDLSQSGAVGNSILNVANGGTGLATATTNGIVFGNGTSAMGVTAAGTQHQVLRAGASGVPSFGAVALDQGGVAVTGTLAVSYGGTGNASLTATQLLIGNGTNPVSQSSSLTFAVAGTTGANELTVGGLKIASTGTSNVILTATDGTNSDIILVPKGTGIVSIGGPNQSGSTIGSAQGENLTISSGAALLMTAATTMTLQTTSSDIVMALATGTTYKVSVSGPSADQYAQNIVSTDLVNAYWVENYAVIDGGTY